LKLFKTDFLKNAGMLFSGSFVAQAISFVAIVFLGRLYSPANFGEFEVFFKLAAVLTAIAGLRYELAIVVEDNTSVAMDATRLSLVINLGFSALVLLLVVLFKPWLADLLKLTNSNFLYLVPLAVWLTGSTETLICWRNRSKEYGVISANRIATSVATMAYKLSHPFLKIISANGLLIGHLLGQVVALLGIARKLPFRLLATTKESLMTVAKRYKSLAIFSTPAALINILATSMPTFLITIYDSTEATGHFANAYKLTYIPLGMLAAALGQVFFERISRLKSNKEEASTMAHQLFDMMFLLAIVPVVIMAVWGDQIAPIVLGSQWQEAGVYIQITILFYFSMYLTTSFSSAFVSYNKLNVQLIYNSVFLLSTFLAMFLVYELGGSTRQALAWFAVVGIVLRIAVINYFFYLFGKNLVSKTIFALLVTGGLLWIGFRIKEGF
jgi:lipopolysaccharide exporter